MGAAGTGEVGLLGMGDPAAGGHQVELARADRLLRPEAVTVEQVPVQQPGDGLESDVRMGANGTQPGLGGAEVISEAPGPDGAPCPSGQRPGERSWSRPWLPSPVRY